MKKILHFLLLTFLLGSCSKTQEDFVIDEFEKFVKENFDDPKDLEEIVAVEITDTTTKESLFEMLALCYELDSITAINDSLYDNFFPKLLEISKKNENIITELSYYKREKIRSLAVQCSNSLIKKMAFDSEEYNKQKESLDSIINSINDFKIIEYKIKARVKESNNLKLKTYYALFNSATDIDIYNDKPIIDNYSGEVSEFFNVFKKYSKSQAEYVSLVKTVGVDIEAIKEYYRECGIMIY